MEVTAGTVSFRSTDELSLAAPRSRLCRRLRPRDIRSNFSSSAFCLSSSASFSARSRSSRCYKRQQP